MAHVIETIQDLSPNAALKLLRVTHAFIAARATAAQGAINTDIDHWGMAAKRMSVDLRGGPDLVGKPAEKFVELINILATTERTIEALEWLSKSYAKLIVRECHSSTSDFEGGNDIVLTDSDGTLRVRCEVCDVVSSNPGQNGKEKKDLKNLGCSEMVPNDDVDRYIATSEEFAAALTGSKRKWSNMHYRYKSIATGLPQSTVMLAVVAE